MKEKRLANALVEIDEESTKHWYSNAKEWDCDCLYCLNFLELAKKRQLPTLVLEVLDDLGISPEKATYVCQIYFDGKEHNYMFSYRIAGNILSSEETDGNFECYYETYPYGAPGFPKPHFDLGFSVSLPLVLEDTKK